MNKPLASNHTLTMKEIVATFKDKLNITLTPSGLWEWDSSTNKKKAVDMEGRVDYLSWDKHPNDNMARTYLKGEYLVVDIDGRFASVDDTHIHIADTKIKLPLTFYTVTTKGSNIHAYYKVDNADKLPRRTVSAVAPNIDTFTYGTVFEGHMFERGVYKLYANPIATLSEDHPYMQILLAYNSRLNSNINIARDIYPVSKPAIYNAVKLFVADDFPDQKKGMRNNVIKTFLPHNYLPHKGERPDLTKMEMNYSLINDLATKMSTVAELSTDEMIAFLRTFVTRLGFDPDYQGLLEKNILATLPNREAIAVDLVDDAKSIQEMIDAQPNTSAPAFKTSAGGKVAKKVYIRLNSVTYEPIYFNGTPFVEEKFMSSFNPERTLYNNAGVPVGWDDGVPIVDTINCPYSPPISYDYTPIVNLYRQTEYLKQAIPRKIENLSSNLIGRLSLSTLEPLSMEVMYAFYHTTIWGNMPPIMTPWMATGENTEGGTGKSIITLTLLSTILGQAAVKISFKDLKDGWGDILIGKRHISLEDIEKLSAKEADILDGAMKQVHSASAQTINMKGGSITNEVVRLSLSASSNHIPYTTVAQRRIFALEPAHLDDSLPNKALSKDDAQELDIILKAEYSNEIQDFVNHLYYLHQQPMSDTMYEYLYIAAPHTKYKDRWIGSKKSHSARVYRLINHPDELMGYLHIDNDTTEGVADLDNPIVPLVELFRYLVLLRKDAHTLVPLSWKWYQYLLVHVQDEHNSDKLLSKSKESIRQSLKVDEFVSNTGLDKRLAELDKHIAAIDDRLLSMPAAGPRPMLISDESIDKYITIIKELM